MMIMNFLNYSGFYPRINYYKSFLNNLIFISNMFKTAARYLVQTSMKMNWKLILIRNCLRVSFQKKYGMKSRSKVLLYGRTNLITKE